MPMPTLNIDFVSDVVCPWCAIGLASLEQAIAKLGNDIRVELHFQPFQLNPDMPLDGQDITEHLSQKYGSTPEQQAQTYAMIRARGAEVGFDFRLGGRGRTWNTFDCHRLLYWAGEWGDAGTDSGSPSIQHRMKKELLKAYFTEGHNPADRAVLLGIVERLGLDVAKATSILDRDDYAAQVRARQRFYHAQDIHGVPAVIINDRFLISGGQPVSVFEQALRQAATQSE